MPVDFLTDVERVRLRNFPREVPDNDVSAYFTLSESDIAEIMERHGEHNRLGFALQLCALRYLGFSPDNFSNTPFPIVLYICSQLCIAPEALEKYGDRSQTRTDHLKDVMVYLKFRNATQDDIRNASEWLLQRALEHDRPILLLEMICRKLHEEKVVRPGISILERLVSAARKRAQLVTYKKIAPLLTENVKDVLHKILQTTDESKRSMLSWLRKKAEVNKPRSIINATDKLLFLESWGVDRWDLSDINHNRLKLLCQIGKKSTIYELQRMLSVRLYPILIALLKQLYEETIDEAIEIFDRYLADADARAKRELEEYRGTIARSTNAKVKLLEEIGSIILDSARIQDEQLRGSIYEHISPDKLEAIVEECRKIRRPIDDNHIDFFAKNYGTFRQFIPGFFRVLSFRSDLKYDLLDAVEVIRKIDEKGKRAIPNDAPLSFIPTKWEPYVFDEGIINRRYYELCTLWELRGAIRSGNVWILSSRRYANLENYLIPRGHWAEIREEICQLMQVPKDAQERLIKRKHELEDLLKRVDKKLSYSQKVRIEDGKIVISPIRAEPTTKSVKKLRKIIAQRLPRVDIPSLLIEVDSWVNFSRHFEHAGGSGPKSKDLLPYIYASILAQAFNFALTDMADSAGLSYHQILWCTRWYLRERTLKPGFNDIVNYQFHQPLSKHWGGGTLSSSDGQRFPASRKVKKATKNPRYFGYEQGLTYHSWTSDQFSQYGTIPAPSTIRDATYVLDGIIDNETELPILEHTTDTTGYTYLIFALFDLLGFKFSPRIRDIGDQSLYYIDSTKKYRKLDPVLKKKINLERISEHWDDLLRVAASIKLGWVTASLFVSKLQAYPRQNAITQALQEYGRIEKTIFILRYLESEDYRRYINKQLNKGEALHDLRNFLRIKKGRIKKKQDEEILNQALCLNLLTNAVITWNTVYMTAVIDQLKEEGFVVDDSDIALLSPARYEHINPYGRYNFRVEENFGPGKLRPLRQP